MTYEGDDWARICAVMRDVEGDQRGVGGSGGAHSRPEHCSSVNVVPQRPGS
jgi:hypothetical protein